MTGIKLLPRLSPLGVEKCLSSLQDQTDGYLEPGVSLDHRLKAYEAHIWYAASGGSVDRALVEEIMGKVSDIAHDCGYPAPATDHKRASFDTQVAAYFGQHPDLGGGELLRDDVWAFMSCVLLQEFTIWRYSVAQKARFAGGVRNTFQRLWVRGRTLDLGPEYEKRWHLLGILSEDAMVQIFERASIASNARLARAIAIAWEAAADRIGRGRMEKVMRHATKLIRLRNQVIDLSYLSEEALTAEINSAFTQASSEIATDTDAMKAEDEQFSASDSLGQTLSR
ncbi:DUF6339 family protein [Cobetia marina]|uniref:DUF6339 family protein n=1 Tax=Cobetia marina TaxID=28258 RepID=UPI00174EA45A